MVFRSDTFSKEAVNLVRSQYFDMPITLAGSCSDDAVIDPTAYSILGMIFLLIALLSKMRSVDKVTNLPVKPSSGTSFQNLNDHSIDLGCYLSHYHYW